MFKKIAYWFWKRRAKKAIDAGLIAQCHGCKDPIVPGDFVAIGEKRGEKVLLHAGFHFSVSAIDAYCTTGAVGNAVWDGKEAVSFGESLATKAMRTQSP